MRTRVENYRSKTEYLVPYHQQDVTVSEVRRRTTSCQSADLQMRHQKLFTLARHLSVGHFE